FEQCSSDDFRHPSRTTLPNHFALTDGITQIRRAHDTTAGQVALVWLLLQGPDVIPIP
ncbi:uncharacterized protein BXZ73DRAFT_15598, partial [Epithele typhae]|uniref:uncharacterized protein n=1 Tax=Epithele typhae TaxID=378194 RepID=UPI0020085CDA